MKQKWYNQLLEWEKFLGEEYGKFLKEVKNYLEHKGVVRTFWGTMFNILLRETETQGKK